MSHADGSLRWLGTMNRKQLEQYYADIEYDNLREEGYWSPLLKSAAELEEEKKRLDSLFNVHADNISSRIK